MPGKHPKERIQHSEHMIMFVCTFAASARTLRILDFCYLQDSSPRGHIPDLGAYHVSRILFYTFLCMCVCVFVFVCHCNTRPKASKKPSDLRASYYLTFRITSSPVSASIFCTNAISQIVYVILSPNV